MSKPLLSISKITLLAFALSPVAAAQAQTIGFDQEGAGPFDYGSSSNWVGGTINGIWDSSLILNANQTVTFGANTSLNATNGVSLNFSFASDNGSTGRSLLLRSDGTANQSITLGGDVLVNTAAANPFPAVTIGSFTANQNLAIDLGSQSRIFNVTSSGSRAIAIRNAISGASAEAGVTKIGSGILNYDGSVHSYTGNTVIYGNGGTNNGELRLSGSARAEQSDFILNAAGVLNINHSGNGSSSLTRGKSLTFNSGSLNISGTANAGTNSLNDQFTNGITVNGLAQITINVPTGKYHRVSAGSFTQNNGGSTFFRGKDLGVNTIASATVDSSNIVFTSAPTLSGTGLAGTSTVGIIAGAYGDISATGSGGGLVTYDTTYGVRLLSAAEYTGTLANGSGNVKLDTPGTTTLNDAATIQSLSLATSGAAGSKGITIDGTDSLHVSSGTIFANQSVTGTPTAADALVISKTLDFQTVEGKILVGSTTGTSNGITVAPLKINGIIAGSNGFTKGGGGNLELSGGVSNTYSGTTTVNGGNLVLVKTGGATAITGDLVINAGVVYQNSNQISDSSNVTINGGSWRVAPSGSGGSASTERIASLTVNQGGAFAQSSSGVTGGSITIDGAVNLNGGSYTQINGYDANVGSMTLSGGTALLQGASNTNTTILTVNGDLTINNTSSAVYSSTAGDYTPITLNASASAAGARIVMGGNLVFNGNSTNGNSAVIQAGAGTNLGFIDINNTASATTRDFTVNDGAARNDLVIAPAITNTNAAGSLNKKGTGTLVLTGANTYTGSTIVTAGSLIVNGSIGGTGVTVNAGARLGGSGTINATIGGAGSIDPGNSPGLQTVTQVDPSGGLDFNFELTSKNTLPNWSDLQNDVLRLTSATPLTGALDGDNTLSLYLDAATYASLTEGDLFYAGFYADSGSILVNLSGAAILGFYQDASGSITYNGVTYNAITAGAFTLGEVANGNFSASGSLTIFEYNAVPEPSVAILICAGLMAMGIRRRR